MAESNSGNEPLLCSWLRSVSASIQGRLQLGITGAAIEGVKVNAGATRALDQQCARSCATPRYGTLVFFFSFFVLSSSSSCTVSDGVGIRGSPQSSVFGVLNQFC